MIWIGSPMSPKAQTAMNFESTITRDQMESEFQSDEDVSRSRKRRNLIVALLVIVAVAFVAWKVWSIQNAGASDGDANRQAPRVTVVAPGKTQVELSIAATGSLAARREMPVGVVGEGGMITRVWVEAGDWVSEGQVLASIERSVQSQETSQLSASVRAAEADARLAQSNLERGQALVSRGFVSKADIDRLTATRDAARARVAVAEAQLGANRARIGRLDIRAPASGLVLTRNAEPGQVVGAGSGVLFRLARGGEMEMRALLAEGDLARLSVGRPATVTPVGTTSSFTGQIWQMSPVIDPQTRQGTARIALAYAPALRPGGFATAKITSARIEAPLLPESAVLTDSRGNFVFVVGKDNKVNRRGVTTADVTDRGIPITSGLDGSELVVLSAGGFLNPGETINPDRTKPAR
jgi:RND family efflux transporter MFP subunit